MEKKEKIDLNKKHLRKNGGDKDDILLECRDVIIQHPYRLTHKMYVMSSLTEAANTAKDTQEKIDRWHKGDFTNYFKVDLLMKKKEQYKKIRAIFGLDKNQNKTLYELQYNNDYIHDRKKLAELNKEIKMINKGQKLCFNHNA